MGIRKAAGRTTPPVVKIVACRNWRQKGRPGQTVVAVEDRSDKEEGAVSTQLYTGEAHQWFFIRPGAEEGLVNLQSIRSGCILLRSRSHGFLQGRRVGLGSLPSPEFTSESSKAVFWLVGSRFGEPTSQKRAAARWLAGGEGPAWLVLNKAAREMVRRDPSSVRGNGFPLKRVVPAEVGDLTQTTVANLLRSAKIAQAGKSSEANSVLEEMGRAVEELAIAAGVLKALADLEHEPIIRSLQEITGKIGENHRRASELEQRVKSTVAEIKGLKTGEEDVRGKILKAQQDLELSLDELGEHQRELDRTEKAIDDAVHELKEAAKWSWVPVYGQIRVAKAAVATVVMTYRSVKTLVQEDITKASSLKKDIRDYSTTLDRHHHEAAEAEQAMCALEDTLSKFRREEETLRAARLELEEHDRALRHKVGFLSDIALFWGRVRVLLQSGVKKRLQRVQVLAKILKERMKGPSGTQVYSALNHVLIEFGQYVDGKPVAQLKPGVEEVAWEAVGNALHEPGW